MRLFITISVEFIQGPSKKEKLKALIEGVSKGQKFSKLGLVVVWVIVIKMGISYTVYGHLQQILLQRPDY